VIMAIYLRVMVIRSISFQTLVVADQKSIIFASWCCEVGDL
jgi:hypothetical protein